MRGKKKLFLLLAVLLFPFLCLGVHTLINRFLPDTEPEFTDSYAIGYEQGPRSISYTSVDATEDLIFFVYSGEGNLIDAYDNTGAFRFTLFFRDRENSGLSACCRDGLLYVRGNGGTIFAFDGDREVERMDAKEARERGVYVDLPSWRGKTNIAVRGNVICRLDDQGNTTMEVPLPGALSYDRSVKRRNGLLVLLIPVALVACWLCYKRAGGSRRLRRHPGKGGT